MRKFLRESLTFSAILPLAGTVKDLRAKVTFLRLLTTTLLMLRNVALPRSPAPPRRLSLNLRFVPTVIVFLVPRRPARAGGNGPPARVGSGGALPGVAPEPFTATSRKW